MHISEVIRRKGDEVVTVRPDAKVSELLALLTEHRIGAVVVSQDEGESVAGIVSERDVVHHLNSDGPGILTAAVATIMTSEVLTCSPEDDVEQLARRMTEGRFRHVPVVVEEKLTAIVSIGDIVKHRIDTLEMERDQLVGYIQQ